MDHWELEQKARARSGYAGLPALEISEQVNIRATLLKKKTAIFLVRSIDWIVWPITYMCGLWLRNVRRAFSHLPLSRRTLRQVGVLPVRYHYGEVVIRSRDLRIPLSEERVLGGLDLNVGEQLELLEKFDFNSELADLPLEDQRIGTFHYHNGWFESGDAEFLFNMIRHFKPANIIEVGSGHSTLMVRYAIDQNIAADDGYVCNHVCIEPYERPWLEQTGAKIIRQRVETLDLDFFQSLDKNDLLFIDSSHVIRPQGDVLFSILEVLGSLKSGAIVHLHDIYTPRDYPEKVVLDDAKLWNEQYLLEAFLSYNDGFRVIGSLNYLWHNYRERLTRVCPVLEKELFREPGSFWLVRN